MLKPIKSTIIDSLSQDVPSEFMEKRRERLRKKSFGNCTNCGELITPENYYNHTICNKKECIRSLLEFCDEDCLNCKYPDCIIYMGVKKRTECIEELGIKYESKISSTKKV